MLLSDRLLHRSFSRDFEHKVSYRYGSPQGFLPLACALIPWLTAAALISSAIGLYLGLFVVSMGANHTEAARIAFIHVPASWAGILIYLAISVLASFGLAFNARLAAMAAQALAPTGLMFAFLGLWTGCLWDKAVDGSWWVWNLQSISELALVLIYIGIVGLHAAIEDLQSANKAGAILLLAGVLGIPANLTVLRGTMSAPSLSTGPLVCLSAMTLGFLLYAGATSLLRLRCVILEQERHSDWVARRGRGAP